MNTRTGRRRISRRRPRLRQQQPCGRPQYQRRFDTIVAPAVSSITYGSERLTAYRVDLSKTGDSIVTDIVDGIAHSQLVLADVSTIGKDSVAGIPYRNGNVMYEVGVALACRHPSEVLLVRDDEDKFLFDVSSIPHMEVDFTNTGAAIDSLREALLARLRERQFVYDARVEGVQRTAPGAAADAGRYARKMSDA